ncbi:RteC domain-containing protein [Carboxylicivirga taeanensis]|uniref:RteC domain-containing protein n=1 Tax=Carboxylicivirga taeanensis TaxID=1416875 RepID=UPI003F6E18AE
MEEKQDDGCKTIMDEYSEEILSINIHTEAALKECEKGITICKTYIQHLREKVLLGCFQTQEDEIHFFKHIKPTIVGDCLFFYYLHRILTKRRQCALHEEVDFIHKKLRKYTGFLKKNYICHAYYSQNNTRLDHEYFIRCNLQADNYNYHPYSMMDSDFATSKDYLFADFYAHEKVIKYLENELLSIELRKKERLAIFSEFISKTSLHWTAKHVDFVELLYALKISRSINNGKVDIKKAAKTLCTIFNLSELDVYRVFVSIKKRQKDKTVFLNYLKDCLEKKIEEDESI